jgi:signal transduction histidine kinase
LALPVAEQKSTAAKKRRKGKAQGPERASESSSEDGGRAAPTRRRPDGDAAYKMRIAELERELAAARATIAALIDRGEREASAQSPLSVFEAAVRLEDIVAERTKEVEDKSAALEAANAELRALTSNLDMIVRQRTRALAESEAQLRRKNEELRRLNLMKAEFISIAAHELRTPMTSIVGYLDLMMEGRFGRLPERLSKPVTSLQRNAQRLKRLVDEMLDVSRIEAGGVILNRGRHAFADIVVEVTEELAPLADAKKQRVHQNLQALEIDCDSDKIHQVVSNLMANAIRYTPEGGEIWITVDQAPSDQYAGSWARLRVRDNGVGIPASQRSRIFEPFAHVSSVRHHSSSDPDAAGLGLYIARGLVDLHGGLITVDSEEGLYTEFTILLPLADGQ